MKKSRSGILGACMALIMLAAFAGDSMGQASDISWSATSGPRGGTSPLFDQGGSLLNSSGLIVQLVVDPNGDTSFTGGGSMQDGYLGIGTGDTSGWAVHPTAADDVIGGWASSTWTYYAISGGGHVVLPGTTSDVQPYGSTRYYFRWVNATSLGAATEAGFIWASDNSWISPVLGGVGVSKDISYATAPATGWNNATGWQSMQPIPEPGSMALLAIGGIVTAAARRRKRRS